MKDMGRRLDNLEAGTGETLSPKVRAWLGWELTDAERTTLNNEPTVDRALDAIDTASLSPEARRWLAR